MSDDLGRRIDLLEGAVAANARMMVSTDADIYKALERLEKLIGEPDKAMEKEIADLKARVKDLEAKLSKMKK